MMTAAWCWARAEVGRHRRALVVLTVLVGVIVAVPIAAFAGARRTASAYDRFRDETLAREVTVQVDDPAVLDRYAELFARPEVTVGVEVALFPAFSDFESDFDIGIIAPANRAYGIEIDRARLLDGRRPRPGRAREVLASENMARELGVDVGDTVTLSTLSPEQIEGGNFDRIDGPELRVQVVGVGRLPDDLHGPENVNLYATPAFLEAHASTVGHFDGLGGVRLRDGASVASFERAVVRIFGPGTELSVVTAEDDAMGVRDTIRVLSVGLVALGIVAALAAAAAVGYTLTRQLWLGVDGQQTLAALGMTRVDRARGHVMVAIPVALGTALVGGVVAVAASPLLPFDVARRAEPDRGLAIDFVVVAAGMVVSALLVLVVAALFGLWTAPRAIRTAAPSSRPTVAARVASHLRLGPSGVLGSRMALERGSGRNTMPVRSTLVAAAVATVGIAALLVFSASLDRLGTTPARYGINWDLTPDLLRPGDTERFAAQPYVGAVGRIAVARLEIDGHRESGFAMRVDSGNPTFTLLDGRAPANDDDVALGPDQMADLDVGIGDQVSIRAQSGARQFVVVGEVLVPEIDDNSVVAGVVLTPRALDRMRMSDGFEQAVVSWRDGVDPDTALRRFRGAFPASVSVYSLPRPPAEVDNLIRIDRLPLVVAAVLAAVALVAVGHALITSIRRRRRELAVLRSLGFVRAQVGGAVAWQATTIGLLALAIGLPLGVALGRWTWVLVAESVGVATDALTPALTILGMIAIVLVTGNLLAAGPAWVATRVHPARALRVE